VLHPVGEQGVVLNELQGLYDALVNSGFKATLDALATPCTNRIQIHLALKTTFGMKGTGAPHRYDISTEECNERRTRRRGRNERGLVYW
jgi:hypothetical protein